MLFREGFIHKAHKKCYTRRSTLLLRGIYTVQAQTARNGKKRDKVRGESAKKAKSSLSSFLRPHGEATRRRWRVAGAGRLVGESNRVESNPLAKSGPRRRRRPAARRSRRGGGSGRAGRWRGRSQAMSRGRHGGRCGRRGAVQRRFRLEPHQADAAVHHRLAPVGRRERWK